MTLQIAGVVQQPKNLDGVAAEAVNHEMPWIAHSTKFGSRTLAAVPQVIDKNSVRQLLAILGAGTLGVRPNAAALISPLGDVLLRYCKLNELDLAKDLYSLGDSLAVRRRGWAEWACG